MKMCFFVLKEMMGDNFFKLNSILNTRFILFLKNTIKYFVASNLVKFQKIKLVFGKALVSQLTQHLSIPTTKISVSFLQSSEFLNWGKRRYMFLAQQTHHFTWESLNCRQRSDFHLLFIPSQYIKSCEASVGLTVLTQEPSLLSNSCRIQIWWPLDTM